MTCIEIPGGEDPKNAEAHEVCVHSGIPEEKITEAREKIQEMLLGEGGGAMLAWHRNRAVSENVTNSLTYLFPTNPNQLMERLCFALWEGGVESIGDLMRTPMEGISKIVGVDNNFASVIKEVKSILQESASRT